MEGHYLRVGMQCSSTRALGPGNRYVVWLQGCCRRCYGCASPEFQEMEGGELVSVESLADRICATEGIDGITFSGGEPMLQKEALYELISNVRIRRPELTIIVFTGFLKEDFHSEYSRKILDSIDLLVDGEYFYEQNDNKGLRGSANQRLHFLTDRLAGHKDNLEGGKRIYDMHAVGENELWTIGIAPSRGRK